MTDVRTLLHDLAADAPRGHGEDTADRVVDLHRAQDRRRLRWAGVAAAVAVVVAAVPALVPRSPADTAAVAAARDDGAAGLFDVPTRGSLAGDDDVVAAALAASWDDGIVGNDAGTILDPAPEDRRVVYAGEVPGGQVWALVMGRTGTQLAYTWFIDVDPAGGLDLQLATAPARTSAGLPIGLLDVAGDRGPVVVVAMPDQGVTLVPARTDDPRPPDVRSLELADGIAVADVATGQDQLPAYRLGDETSASAPVRQLDQVDTAQPLGPARFANPVFGARIEVDVAAGVQACMSSSGWAISVDEFGTIGYDAPLTVADAADLRDQLFSCAGSVTAAAAASEAAGD